MHPREYSEACPIRESSPRQISTIIRSASSPTSNTGVVSTYSGCETTLVCVWGAWGEWGNPETLVRDWGVWGGVLTLVGVVLEAVVFVGSWRVVDPCRSNSQLGVGLVAWLWVC